MADALSSVGAAFGSKSIFMLLHITVHIGLVITLGIYVVNFWVKLLLRTYPIYHYIQLLL